MATGIWGGILIPMSKKVESNLRWGCSLRIPLCFYPPEQQKSAKFLLWSSPMPVTKTPKCLVLNGCSMFLAGYLDNEHALLAFGNSASPLDHFSFRLAYLQVNWPLKGRYKARKKLGKILPINVSQKAIAMKNSCKKNTSLPLGKWTRAQINRSQEKYKWLTNVEETAHLTSNQRHANRATRQGGFSPPKLAKLARGWGNSPSHTLLVGG